MGVLAVGSMHKEGLIHRDLKLENVMVDLESPRRRRRRASLSSPAQVKIIDLDSVRNWVENSPSVKKVVGTGGYMAPEAYGGDYSPASDMYSIGVIMYVLLTKRWPHPPKMFEIRPEEICVGS